MYPSKHSSRRRRTIGLGAEALESRSLMTGGAGNTFAIIPGTITQPGGTVSIPFTINPANFTLPKHAFTIGIDVVPQTGSNLKPLIISVTNPHNAIVPQTFHSIYDPHLSHLAVASGAGTSAVLSPLVQYPHQPNRPATYTVQVQAQGQTTGSFLLGFYLPGDVQGTGTVTKADLQMVKAIGKVRAGNPKYNFSADTNRDGRIGPIDVAFTLQNLGVSTNISPVVSAELDPADQVGIQPRVTNLQTAHFTGQATPGATITYTNTNNTSIPPVVTTADTNGNYSVNVPLVPGANTINVKSIDAFGQTIQGNLAPVTYIPQITATSDTLSSPQKQS